MKRFGVMFAWVVGTICSWSGPELSAMADDGRPPPSRPVLLVHVMPWFESRAFSGAWGWHWTMNHFNPELFEGNGRRSIASHLNPTLGPYDSLDPAVLEYHTLLMKVAGIDGAIIDWYGSEACHDYARIHARTLALITALKQRGLKFAICYEDRAVRAIAARDKLTPEQATAHAATHLRFCQEHWFRDPAYVQWEGKPLLLVFGPDYLIPAQWSTLFEAMQPAPAFFTLHERKDPAIGSFAWPPMWAAKEGKLDPKDLDAYLDRFAGQPGMKIPGAFPGFHDIYAEAGTQTSHGYLDARNGATFRQTLDRALESKSPVVQVATWNDFGEGTCVEPTREFGTRYLALLQDARRSLKGQRFAATSADLLLPGRIYRLRSLTGNQAPTPQSIDEAVNLLDQGNAPRAAVVIERLEKRYLRPANRATGR